MNVLKELNFQPSDFYSPKNNIFEYDSNLGHLYFIKMESDAKLKQQFYEIHRDIWNENKSEIFIAIIDENEIIICDSKTRPEQENPIENVKLTSFDYGENTMEAQRYIEVLKKENIDNGSFWEEISKFIRERKKEKKRSPIDDDLLNNLIKIRKTLKEIFKDDIEDIDIPQKLIDRCLFIRFIEDRLGFNKLKNILKEQNVKQLLEIFKYYNRALNGDLFEDDGIIISDPAVLQQLENVFGEYYVYTSGQQTLVPYKFDKIPILLISHIYEKFLKKDKIDREGIVFTPENIVNFIVDDVFESESVRNKTRNGKVKILDSACGSGIFLVKSFEKLLTKREQNKGQLDLKERGKLLKECIFGIDLDQNALRVAAFSLYLKIFENVDSKIIKEEVFDRYENGIEHFMFPGLRGKNLINANSIFDDVFSDKFDLILGNPPWGYKFDKNGKQKIDKKWGNDVSNYQSSQCFLHQTKVWMKEDTIVGMVVNISNFTNVGAKDFRAKLLMNYSILKFITLTKIKEISFPEPACILIFTLKKHGQNIQFLIPELTQFSKLTRIITVRDFDKVKFSQETLSDDTYWHISLLGLNKYLNLIQKIEGKNNNPEDLSKNYNNYQCLDDYSTLSRGIDLYSTKLHGDIEKAKRKYESNEKLGPDYYPMVRSTKLIQQFKFKKIDDPNYLKYGPYFERQRSIELFQGDKLVVIRSWPLRVAYVKDTIIFNVSFDILKLKKGVDQNYLQVFEAILNSKLGFFYLDSRYRQRPEGNFSKVNIDSLNRFPIPNIEDKGNVIEDIVKKIENIRNGKDIENNRAQIDNLVFDLYELDYYEKMQVLEYYKLQTIGRKNLVLTEEDFDEYINEFKGSFSFLIKEGHTLNAECYTSDFLGALIKFNFSTEEKKTQYNLSKSLKKLIGIIHKDKINEINYKSVLEENKLRFYNKNNLIIYKSNHLRDWTRTEAINDVKKEIEMIYSNLSD